jgi:hypothetical protein
MAPTSTPRVRIGFTGYLRSGKDSAGSVVRDEHGFHHASFAAKLKDFLYAVDPPIRPATAPGANGPHLLSLAKVVDAVGWERAKDEYPDVRPLLQRTGTEAGRKVLWDNVWVDALMGSLPDGDVVWTDCRFPNEATAIKESGGFLVRITRPGFEPGPDAHESETALDDYPHDLYITNDGTLEDLRAKVLLAYESIVHVLTHPDDAL